MNLTFPSFILNTQKMSKLHYYFSLLFFILFLTGCAKMPLYTNLQEIEANEIMSVLMLNNIPSEKIMGKENTWEIAIDASRLHEAITILKSYGLPRDKFVTLGQAFQKSGLVSSPSEERIRFMYALSQGIAETLSRIDGVITARVHIVLQENDPLSDIRSPSSASVFIKYRRGSGVENMGSQIKRFVTNSIEGLQYDKVSLVFFPAEQIIVSPKEEKIVEKDSNNKFMILVALAVIIVLIAGATGGLLFFTQKKKTPTAKPKAEEGEGK